MFGVEFDRRDIKRTKKMARNMTKNGQNLTDQTKIFDEFKDDMDQQEINLKEQITNKTKKSKKDKKRSKKKEKEKKTNKKKNAKKKK